MTTGPRDPASDARLECVPNVSEGRDGGVLRRLGEAVDHAGARLVDVHSDVDHHRSVFTFLGAPDAVERAALALGRLAVELIDLRRHAGVHPRIGAVDVMPFVPLGGLSMAEAVTIAHRAGRAFASETGVPVFFYEEAALLPGRRDMPELRAGGFERLAERVASPLWRPDAGPVAPHPTAGATVVGARKFLIAYNINLNTPDMGIANKIAKAIRFSSGGLRFAKAMGVDLKARGLAQVSINMTDFEQTPLHRVFETVKREAERYGCLIVGSEIVGLLPKKAIEMTADFYLQLENFSPAQVLENRLAAALSGAPLETKGKLASLAQPFLDAVAEPAATPGGGSVAALAGALAASLGHMVAGLSRKKKSQAAYVEQLSAAVVEMHAAAQSLAQAIDRDSASYEAVMAAFKLPRETPEEQERREEAIQRATRGAAEVPLEVAAAAVEIYERLGQLEAISAASMLSDLRVGRLMAAAAARGALENVAINLESITDAAYVPAMQKRAAALEARLASSPVTAGR